MAPAIKEFRLSASTGSDLLQKAEARGVVLVLLWSLQDGEA